MAKNFSTKTRLAALALLLCMLLTFFALPVFAESANEIKVHMKNTEGLESPPYVTAAAAIIMDAKTGELLYEKNIDKIIYPASTVKIMTAIVVLENVPNLNSDVVISRNTINQTSGNSLPQAMSEGEIFTVWDLLCALLLRGANDAALALAEYVSGSVTDFVALMNKRAVELGCTDTVYANPTGMDSPDMHTTVSDVSKIAFYASQTPEIMEITTLPKYTIPQTNKEREERSLLNRNHFVSKGQYSQYYYEYARGMNYGSTVEAGDCLVTLAEQNELSYLCIVMKSTSTPIPESDTLRLNCFYDAKALLDWAFSIYTYKTVVAISDKIKTVEIQLSANRDTVTLVPDGEIVVLLPQNVDIDKEIEVATDIFEEDLVAPIEKNQQLGKITVIYNGEVVGTANLLSNADVEPSNILYLLDRIKKIVSGAWFGASVVIFVILFALYVAISLVKNNKKEQRRYY
ncbi:MAG: D-alanyl-D-alanine carboxypeptidase [Oscillospiraceae bacterium]|nr:D-alanyl-D-alanine carboxypeptidase [Oscillospiraceae bacterium]